MAFIQKNRNKLYFEKDLINDQTFDNLTVKYNSSGAAFDVSNGLGEDAVENTLVLVHLAGFDDQRIKVSLKYSTATNQGSESIGAMARFQTVDNPDVGTYYYARVDSGEARLTKVVNGTFTTISEAPYPLAQDEWVEIDFRVVGKSLQVKFSTPLLTDVILRGIDNDISSGGILGFRSQESSLFCRSVLVEEL